MSQRTKTNRSNQVALRTKSQHHFHNTDRIVRPLLKALGQCHDVKIACKLMEQLHRALFLSSSSENNIDRVVISLEDENIDNLALQAHKGDAAIRRVSMATAKSILRSDGFAILLVALQHFCTQATAVSCWATRIFTTVTGVIPMASRHLIELGGLRTLLRAQGPPIKSYNSHTNVGLAASITMRLEYILKANMVGLLYNLITNVVQSYQTLAKEAASEKCLEFILLVLETYPANTYVQEWGICYLIEVGKVQDAKVHAFLHKKRVGNLLVSALDHFRDHKTHVNKVARQAMQWYASS